MADEIPRKPMIGAVESVTDDPLHVAALLKQDKSRMQRDESTSPTSSEWVRFDEEDVRLSDGGNEQQEVASTPVKKPPTTTPVTVATTATSTPNKPVRPPLPDVTTPPAVLPTETVDVTLRSPASPRQITSTNNSPAAVIDVPKVVSVTTPALRTIELSTGRIREGFANGDVIVTLLPVNTKLQWITPAIFRPELVPEELMAQGLTLTVEEYVHAMETLVNDFRFKLYNICYKRVLVTWIMFAFCVLLAMLYSGITGITLFSLGVGWLFLNAAAIFLCMWAKLKLARGLEQCMARVNKQLLRHKIILALDDRGRASCHKVNLCFIYFDPAPCIGFLNEFLERNEQNGTTIQPGWEARLDVAANDIVIQGSSTTRLSRKQGLAEALFLRYLQRWGKDFLRRRLDWILEESGLNPIPRHLTSAMCPCQYAEEVLVNKPRKDPRSCCASCNDFFIARGFQLC